MWADDNKHANDGGAGSDTEGEGTVAFSTGSLMIHVAQLDSGWVTS
jgi:hypothetical protein